MEVPRYIYRYPAPDIHVEKADMLVVGSGIAGLYTALKAGERKTVIITKEKTEHSSTDQAQGGIAAVLSDEDSPRLHIEDTLKAGAGLCWTKAVETLVDEGAPRVRELIAMGTEFDRSDRFLEFTREGAHSRPRILHAHGDATGEEIRRALVRNILHLDWISIFEDTYALDLVIGKDGVCKGVLAYDRPQKTMTFFSAPITVLAAGGGGQVYGHTSNPMVATGDGMAMGYRAGATLMDMEFIQFHPTTLYNPGVPTFLVSEAVRGEGGILRNHAQERFMLEYHPQAELAPRDVVARAIFAEMRKDGKPYVWLDVTHLGKNFFSKRFPRIYQNCCEAGIDVAKEYIPVHPAAHYSIGGVRTDIDGQTNIPGLFACGEVAATAVHGANRLASNSLLEGLVFGRRIARLVEEGQYPQNTDGDIDHGPWGSCAEGRDEELLDVRRRLQELMTNKVGIIRDRRGLKQALRTVRSMQKYLNHSYTKPVSWETQNLILLAYTMIQSALLRRESRGSHFRSDYPRQRMRWKNKHIILGRDIKEGRIIELS